MDLVQARDLVRLCSEIPGWISCDPKRPLGSPCEDHLSFLWPLRKFLLSGVGLDVEKFISDAFKTVDTFCVPLILHRAGVRLGQWSGDQVDKGSEPECLGLTPSSVPQWLADWSKLLIL